MKRVAVLMGLLVVLGGGLPAQAQLLVEDPLNLVQNTVQAGESILMVANQLLDLLGLPTIVLAAGAYSEDMATLADIADEAQALGRDLASLQAQITVLFRLETAPHGSTELRERLAAIHEVVFQCYVYALRTQTLLRTTLSTLQHLTLLLGSIEALEGNKQAQQVAIQHAALINKTLVTMQMQTSAFQRAQSAERLERLLVEQSMRNIHEAIMEDYPR